MRCFPAITFPDAVAARLAEVGAACPLGRAVPEENIHLTLAFLGDVAEHTLEELNDGIEAVSAQAFSLRFSGLGTFGRGDGPRALYANVAPEADLTDLQRHVRGKIRKVGIELGHRRFIPHVTLVRFPHGTIETAEYQRYVAAHAGLALGPVKVRSFALFGSHLRPNGAVYEELARYPLRGL